MSFSSQDRADLRQLLRTKLNGKVDGFQDTDLNAMLKKGLSTENKLAATSWQELSEVALLPCVLVQALLEAYNKNALDEPGSTAQQLAMGNWSSDGTSNCFNMGDLIIAANQIADGQEGSSRFRGVSRGWRPTRKRSQYDNDGLPEWSLSNKDELVAVLARFKHDDSPKRSGGEGYMALGNEASAAV
ncbi:hypothetical protein WJX82_001152 [Trebouxia sp. C0006]